jgi:hypothetical protein
MSNKTRKTDRAAVIEARAKLAHVLLEENKQASWDRFRQVEEYEDDYGQDS